MAIPKKIHYCWLSGEKMPKDTIECMKTWKKIMPEYELILWDKNKFDIKSVPFVEEACRIKKWATASDYIRLYAIYTEGGIYMDTDVYVLKNFDGFLHNGFFTSVEYWKEAAIKSNAFELLNEDGTIKNQKDRIFTRAIGMQAAVFGGVNGHLFVKSCMDWYRDNLSILTEGIYNNKIIAPAVYADVAIEYGFRYKDELQKLKYDMAIYPSYIFAGHKSNANPETYAIHCCSASWRDKTNETLLKIMKRKIGKNNILRKIFGKELYKKPWET
jgi:mannosyltransferase OCH1-like enzyme